MRQGRASVSGRMDTKREPMSHAVNPHAAGQIGLAQPGRMSDGNHTSQNTAEALNAGRGFTAPAIGTAIHHSGSQGKHR